MDIHDPNTGCLALQSILLAATSATPDSEKHDVVDLIFRIRKADPARSLSALSPLRHYAAGLLCHSIWKKCSMGLHCTV
jgi:hypothetical protein